MESVIKNSASILLSAYTLKMIVKGPTMADAIVVAFLASLVGISQLIDHIKFKGQIQAAIETHQKDLAILKAELAVQKQEIQAATSYVSAVKLQNNFRPKTG